MAYLSLPLKLICKRLLIGRRPMSTEEDVGSGKRGPKEWVILVVFELLQ